ncbi:MAG: hypothetical protein HPY50_09250 [Firmicutes bacterium]|nr:hypothetical protein [Bacillota bacterium]
MDLLGNFSREWDILASAPATFIFSVVVAFSAAYFVARLRYESLLKSKDQEIERLTQGREQHR